MAYLIIGQKMRLHPGLDPYSARDRLQSDGLWIDPDDSSVTIDVEGDPSITIKEHWLSLAPGSWLAYWDDDQCAGWVLTITPDSHSSAARSLLVANLSDVIASAAASHARDVSHSALLLGTDFSSN